MSLPDVRFAHEPLFDQSRGKVKVYCRPCGVQSPKFETMAEANTVYMDHVGLKEMEKRHKLK